MYRFVPIAKSMEVNHFQCEQEELVSYFKKYARQNHEKRIATCIVCLDQADQILGYYTFAMAQVAKQNLPPDLAKGIPGYPLGAIRIGRLARDRSMKGKGVGEALLRDCLQKVAALTSQKEVSMPAFRFILVDAKNDYAARFYESFGFVRFPDTPNLLVMTVETILKASRR
jgi:predicted GNAT family N-acyltransferase